MMTKEDRIVEYLLGCIDRGELAQGDKVPSQYALSDRFSVNKETANKALTRLVSMGILERKKGRGGTVVTGDRHYPKGVIGFLIYLGDALSYPALLLRGAQIAAYEKGYQIAYLDCNPFEVNMLLNRVARSGMKGLLTARFGCMPENFSLPVLYVDSVDSRQANHFNYVISDNRMGGRLMAQHVLAKGHRDFAYVVQYANRLQLDQRREGFFETCREAGISNLDKRTFTINERTKNYQALLDEIGERLPGATVLVFGNDVTAFQVYSHLHAKGVRIPEEISITGFGAVREYMEIVKLTTVEQHPEEVGHKAVEKMIDMIDGRSQGLVQLEVPVELLEGRTLANL